ncbi:MAG: methylated-DNA--[protein]-cysteine S-methyltransferase [Kosmotoga sp.]|nr:MAG: methylated-DNA--[protein]-cysteine S-methyltransferase [Kosmotoga sp.]
MMQVGVVNAKPGSIQFHISNNKLIKIDLMPSHGEEFEIEPFYSQLKAYLAGLRKEFDLKYTLGVSKFTERVLNATRSIPYGKTMTYGQIARMLGKPGAARAVGQSLKTNPLPIIIPCHRVVSKTGSGGFSAGIEWKDFLCNLEYSSAAE